MTQFVVALFASGMLALSQAAPPAPAISVVVSKGTALLTFSEYQGLSLDLKRFSGAALITTGNLLSVKVQGQITYVVVEVSGPTRASGGSGYCGAGEEANLIWLKLRGPEVLDVSSVRHYSCAFSIETLNRPQDMKEQWRVEYESFSEKRKFVWTYDERTPERGVSVVSSAAQTRPTFREALAGFSDLDNFHDLFLDSPVPDPKPGRRYVLVGVHLNPSAASLLVFSSDFTPLRELYGWELLTLPSEAIVYHQSQVHFAPTHVLEISVFDPATMLDRQIYPPASPAPVRLNFIERVAKAYRARGEDWFRLNNHHMNPSKFDSSLSGPITLNERAGTMTFPVGFAEQGNPPDEPAFGEDVLVTCAPLAPADRIQCRETPAP